MYGPLPGPHVSDGPGEGQAADVVEELGGGLQALLGQHEPQVVDLLLCELELLGVEHDAPQAALL